MSGIMDTQQLATMIYEKMQELEKAAAKTTHTLNKSAAAMQGYTVTYHIYDEAASYSTEQFPAQDEDLL